MAAADWSGSLSVARTVVKSGLGELYRAKFIKISGHTWADVSRPQNGPGELYMADFIKISGHKHPDVSKLLL